MFVVTERVCTVKIGGRFNNFFIQFFERFTTGVLPFCHSRKAVKTLEQPLSLPMVIWPAGKASKPAPIPTSIAEAISIQATFPSFSRSKSCIDT